MIAILIISYANTLRQMPKYHTDITGLGNDLMSSSNKPLP